MPDAIDQSSVAPIHIAAAHFFAALREEQCVRAKSLLDEFPQLAAYNIHAAAAVGRPAQVAAFLAADPSRAITPGAHDGTEPIIYAAYGGLQDLLGVSDAERLQTVGLLLDAGASANSAKRLNHDPNVAIPALYFACVSNNAAVARLLLERGAHPNDGESVFHAAERNHRACLALLVEFGADISQAHAVWGNTPLYFLANYKESHPDIATVTSGMEWLLQHGADPNVVSHLTQEGQPGRAETPLHRIADNGRPAYVAQLLIEHGARVDTPRGDGKTAYLLARRAANQAVAEYLAGVGANTSVMSPIDQFVEACLMNDASAARSWYVEHESVRASIAPGDVDVFMRTVETDCTDTVMLLLDLGWSLTDESPWGGTPLHWAAWHGSVNTARAFIARGAPLNVRDHAYGSSPIAWAAHGSRYSRRVADAQYVTMVELLITAGATPAEAVNKWNEPAYALASETVAAVMRPWSGAV